MIFPADTSVKEMSTFDLQVMLEDIQAELYNRKKTACENTMTELYKLIEKIQAKNYNIELIDIDGNEMILNHITEVHDHTFDTGYVFGNHPDIIGESSIKVPLKNDEKPCIHANDSIGCSQCEIRYSCWNAEYWNAIEKAKKNLRK